MAENKQIPLVNLVVGKDNPRFLSSAASQKDAVDKLFDEYGDKNYELAKNILEHGVNPNEKLMVMPSADDKTSYVVLDGNRRVATLKVLSNPNTLDQTRHSGLKNKFKKLHDLNSKKLIKELDCVVYTSYEEARPWISIKHDRGHKGAGTETWEPDAKSRFNLSTGKPASFALQFKDCLRNSPVVPNNIISRIDDIPSTNIDRLFGDDYVRSRLGVTLNGGTLESNVAIDEVLRALIRISEDFLFNKHTVDHIKKKKDRKDYIDRVYSASKLDLTKKAERSWRISNPSGQIAAFTSKKRKPKRTQNKRRALIPSSFNLNIKNQKLSDIFYELQSINVERYPNATAVLFRVFLELSCDCFVENKTMGEYQNLQAKVLAVANHLKDKKLASKPIIEAVIREVKDKNGLLNIETFNAYIHNRIYTPKARNLFVSWNNIQDFMKILWDDVS